MTQKLGQMSKIWSNQILYCSLRISSQLPAVMINGGDGFSKCNNFELLTSYGIPLRIIHRPLLTSQILYKAENFVDIHTCEWTYGLDVQTLEPT